MWGSEEILQMCFNMYVEEKRRRVERKEERSGRTGVQCSTVPVQGCVPW